MCVRHAGSLAWSTDGLLGVAETTLSLSLSSTPAHLKRIRLVLDRLAQRVPMGAEEVQQLQTAVGEACANAITHGSPQGARNHVTVSFHLDPESLVVEVADEGPGFRPGDVPVPRVEEMPEHGFGIHMMRQLTDRLEFFRDPGGTLVRLTKFLAPAV